MRVLATAGHVDHGKSALVRALTGMEPDRYDEERRRGLTLDLGFVWTRLDPDGEPLAFVDVPGHERFVATMLAGVGPVPAVLFVVAADQGWQPQSEEHLAILDALGVRHAVLAVTRSDLADPEPVRADAVARLAGTSLGKVASVAVSSVTGAGLDELRGELARLAAELPAADADADVRLWLDRAFTVRGHGTVVTGTLGAGTLRVGDRLVTGDGAAVLRVRGLQSLHEERAAVGGVARVAVNVHGQGDGTLRRGHVLLTPDRWLSSEVIDVRVTGEPVADLPRSVTLHIGTAAVPVTVRPLGEDTARLALGRALPLRVGDRAVLREPGGSRMPCGVTVLDVRPPRLTRRGAGRARAAELADMTGRPDAGAELRRRRLMRRADLHAMGVPLCPTPAPQGPAGTAGREGPVGTARPESPAGPTRCEGSLDTARPEGPAGTVRPESPAGPARCEGSVDTAWPEGPAGTVRPESPAGTARRGGPVGTARSESPAGTAGPGDGAGRVSGGPVGPVGPVAGDWLVDGAYWTSLKDRLAAEVGRHARAHPLEPGLPTEAARRLLGLPDRALVDALAAAQPLLHTRQGRLYPADSPPPALPAPVRAAVDALRRDLTRSPFRAPEAGRLAELGLDRRALAAAAAAGTLLRIADGIVLLPGADADAAAVLRALPQPFTLSEARRALDTTRRVAVPLLEFLDARGYTERVDDQRRRCRAKAAENGGGRESNPFLDPNVTCDDAGNPDK
ncbi:SelB C-terminal domain-containing protein [Streptomyces sp. SP2-10]|uniref:SelB domain-containing protein n=1 Tax=Streptomyces sp. SP2-10 TaxID=2873385 RepID=UPI001CA67490|nr:SelB C-terminal domain-containing protein [Streptomyces sp. SP2-10]MBY8841234.1 SelB C-terminal domain-containing protein [Streptomyces sp. SP2-10]